MASFNERLEEALVMRDMKPSDLARITGIGEGSISQWRKGAYKASQRNLDIISEALRVPIPWLMGVVDTLEPASAQMPYPSNIIPLPETYDVPLVGDIACGQPIPALEDAEERVSVPVSVRANFALRCKGDSMITARIFDGDIVYIRKQAEVENGQIAAVRIGDEATLKRVYYNQQDGRLVLRACNPLYSDMVYEGESLNEIEVLGLAVAFTSAVRHE